jgi:hypothetical protein
VRLQQQIHGELKDYLGCLSDVEYEHHAVIIAMRADDTGTQPRRGCALSSLLFGITPTRWAFPIPLISYERVSNYSERTDLCHP